MSDQIDKVEAALILTDYQLGRINQLTGRVEDALSSLAFELHVLKPTGSQIMDILAAEVRRLRQIALIDENEQLKRARQWLPIESAPRDGTEFIGLVKGRARFVKWTKTSHVPMYGWCLVDQGFEDCDLCEPLLWMPMPEPPKGGGK